MRTDRQVGDQGLAANPAKADAATLFARHPFALTVVDRVARVVESIGEATIRTTTRQLAFRRRRGFAYLWPPVFGTVSKFGAFAALVAFNLIQLLGKLHRDAIQPPSSLALRGVWRGGGR